MSAGRDVEPGRRAGTGTFGLFGGTFDPIHVGHLAVAEEAADTLGLDTVVFMPTAEPPHKPGRTVTDPAHRLAMVEAAIAGNPRFTASRMEIDRGGPSYTVDTLEGLAADPAPFLIISADAFLGLPTWREPSRVLALARLAIAPRDGFADATPDFLEAHFPGSSARAVFLDGPRIHLSASELRARAAAGRSLRYLVPDAVAAYISDHALYLNHRRDHRS